MTFFKLGIFAFLRLGEADDVIRKWLYFVMIPKYIHYVSKNVQFNVKHSYLTYGDT